MNKSIRRVVRIVLPVVAIVLSLLVANRFLRQEVTAEVLPAMVEQVSLLSWAALILVSAASGGMAVLRLVRLRPKDASAAGLFGTGIGLGILSLLTFVLGVTGSCSKATAVVLLLAFLLAGLRDLGESLRAAGAALKKVRTASAFRIALGLVLGLFLLMNLTRAFQPPVDYDSLEYHVAAPAAYHRAGRVHFIRDNVYANFPQNTEMLYFLAMRLTDSPDRGALVGQLLGTACGFLAALALRGMIRRLADNRAADVAALFFYSWPGVTKYSGMPYVELPLIFYGTLAVWGLLWSWRRKRTAPGARGWVLLAGMAAGFAMGVKYTAALLVFAPILIWLVVLGLVSRIKLAEVARRAGCFVGVSILLFSPWLVRNAVNTRNPVYPLLYNVFGSTNWDAGKDARWTQAHSAKDLSLENAVKQAKDVLFFDERSASLLLLAFVPFVLLARRRTGGVILMLAGHAVLLFLLWFVFTQQASRFLEIGVPILAALSALGLGAALRFPQSVWLRPIVIVLLLLGPSRWHSYRQVASSLRFVTVNREEVARSLAHRSPFFDAMSFINDPQKLPSGVKVLFLGDARTFYCRRDCVAGTVFDTNPLEEIVRASSTGEDMRDRLRAAGITHLYVDTTELVRLQNTYQYDYDGEKRLGMLHGFRWNLFAEFAEQYLEPQKVFGIIGPKAQAWEDWEDLRRRTLNARRREPVPGHFVALYALR